MLERILQEIEELQAKDNADYKSSQKNDLKKSNVSKKIDCAANNGFQRCAEKIKKIIRSNMGADDWIPVSERLPEDEYSVLITDGYMVTVGWLGRDSQEWYTGLVRWSEKYQNSVLAWMPLPEPYKEEKHGSDD